MLDLILLTIGWLMAGVLALAAISLPVIPVAIWMLMRDAEQLRQARRAGLID